jgi:hypothetical protein
MRADEVVSVRVAGPLGLRVRFADGVSGEVEFRETFFRGAFAQLRDPARFAEVHCEQGFVEWPGDLDLAPDAMHEALCQSGRWVLQ